MWDLLLIVRWVLRLPVLAAMLRIWPRLWKIRVGILKKRILVAVPYLPGQVRLALGGAANLFFDRALMNISIRMF
jgi:hypothetical protein